MNYFVTVSLVLFAWMIFWFVVSLIKRRNDVADLAWGFVLMAWASFTLKRLAMRNWRGLMLPLKTKVG